MATNYLEMGAEVLQERMETYAGLQATYRRVSSKVPKFSFPIVVVPGRNPIDIVDTNGVVLRGQAQDFSVMIEKWLARAAGDPKNPIRGDEIIVQLGQFKVVFVVSGEDFARSHYEPADSYGKAWRIHSKSDRRI